jgi:hypothetical protein
MQPSTPPLAAVLYLTAPIVERFYYSTELARGSYPVNADSIGLPIGLFTIVWLIGLPVAAALIWFVLRSYPGSVSVFGFNAARPYWSAVWSLKLRVSCLSKYLLLLAERVSGSSLGCDAIRPNGVSLPLPA